MFKILERGQADLQSMADLEKRVTQMMRDGWRVHSVGRWEVAQSFWVAMVKDSAVSAVRPAGEDSA